MRLEPEGSRVIIDAADVAREFGHSYVGSEHLLLALVRGGGWISQLLRSYGLNGNTGKCIVGALWGGGIPDMPLPQGFTEEARSILYDAGQEARNMGRRAIDKRHILLALLRRPMFYAYIVASIPIICNH